ncbi:MAG: hypothetical protein IIZ92_18850 [Aquincola sp.]|nr:hypothetical protein [Aquincola sp.]
MELLNRSKSLSQGHPKGLSVAALQPTYLSGFAVSIEIKVSGSVPPLALIRVLS